jgi:superoxide reductase
MATKKSQIYKCSVCGNIVEVVHEAAGTLVCCNQQMVLQEENSTDAAGEKHVPVIEQVDGGIKVKVGSVAHPMQPEHYIEWIQVLVGDASYRAFLEPGQAPEATFPVSGDGVVAREYCNLHGLWRAG